MRAYDRGVLAFSVLGPIEVRRDGELLSVPAGKTSELLVRLALDAGQSVRTDRLVDDLWAADAVNTRRNTLHSKVAKLRRALGDPGVLVGLDGGYRLAVEASAVDALLVLTHTANASRLFEDGDHRGAAELCVEALEMYRGDVLQGAGEGDWVAPHRVRLDEARMRLLETLFSSRLRLDAGGDVIGELESAVAAHSLHEGLWELLITALYRAGRQADALAAYQRVRRLLSDELGLDPGPRLQQLEQRVLSHDQSLGDPRSNVRPFESGHPTGNLPSLSVELVGREAELTAVCDLLARERLVEIVGPGGIGKTALAIAAGRKVSSAHDVADGGVWLARLETAVTADDVVDTLIAALHVTGGEAALVERLKGSAALVILDNCEHVLDVAAALAGRLLDAADGIRILCTSQVPLDVDGEVVLELAPLGLADAVDLFTRRSTAQHTSRTLEDADADDAVRALCLALDGLPLAIELAAARTKTLSVGEIIRRLDNRFAVLSDPTSRRPERRRALRETIRWSYDLLFPDDQRGLWALATFADGAPLAAVEFVLEALDVPRAAAIDVVGRLAGRSLVLADVQSGSMSDRYRLLDSIRAFALEAMADAGLAERAFAAHASWFADAARSSTEGVRSSRQAEQLEFARAERANIDTALAWSSSRDPLLALRIANGFGWAWVVLGDSRGAQRILAALGAAGDAARAEERCNALLLAAWLEASTGDAEPAREHTMAAAELADAGNDKDLQARCCYYRAYVVSHHGDFGEALELTERARVLYDGLDRPWDQAANGLFAARAAISAGDEPRSVESLGRVEHWLESVDDPWLRVRSEAMLGELARLQHRLGDAVVHLARAAETSQRLGFLQTAAYQTFSLGRAQCQADDYQTGCVTLETAIDKAEATGDVRLAALARVHLGRTLRALGQRERARAALATATAWHRAAGGGEQAALGECLLAAMDAADHVPGAEERLVVLLDDARLMDAAHVEVLALDALALMAAESGDIHTALSLCSAADDRMAAASNVITVRDRCDAHSVRLIIAAVG